jgi:hypothetical protein
MSNRKEHKRQKGSTINCGLQYPLFLTFLEMQVIVNYFYIVSFTMKGVR